MELQTLSFRDEPERITRETWDCIWAFLRPRATPSPLETSPLEWIDWKLQGQVSRALEAGHTGATTLFIPTMRRLSAPYVAVEQGGWQSASFLRNCEGMKLKRIACVLESAELRPKLEAELRSLKGTAFPLSVDLIVEEGRPIA